MPPELPGLIGTVKAQDPGCCWFFERADALGTAPPGIEGIGSIEGIGIWVDSFPDLVHLAANAAGPELASRHWTPAIRPRTRPIRYPGRSGRDVRDELSAASSDFALRLLTARTQPHRAPIALAIAHMRTISALVPEAGRLPFLFQCWHHWAATLPARARLECAENAPLWVNSVAPEVAPEQAPAGPGPAWTSYQRALLDIIGDTRAGTAAPVNYLLFDHAHRTHARLGISPAAEALAARVVRTEHAAGVAPAGVAPAGVAPAGVAPAGPAPLADLVRT